MLNLNTARINSLLASEEAFPIDLDDAWQWIGYQKKQNATDTLSSAFEEGVDYSRSTVQKPQAGRPSHSYKLTIDTFKCLAMMAKTEKGKEVRQYFLECERELKRSIQEQLIPDLLHSARHPRQLWETDEGQKRAKDLSDSRITASELTQLMRTIEENNHVLNSLLNWPSVCSNEPSDRVIAKAKTDLDEGVAKARELSSTLLILCSDLNMSHYTEPAPVDDPRD